MYHIVASPDEDRVSASPLAELYPVFLASLQVRPTTLNHYQMQTLPFWEWWARVGPPDYVLTMSRCRTFAEWLVQNGRTRSGAPLRQNTVRTILRRVRQFFRWLYTSGRLPIDISTWIPVPSIQYTRNRILDTGEIRALFALCRGANRIRDMALLAFLLETGCRRIEAANAMWSNVDFASDWAGQCFLEVTKGYRDIDKRRIVVFGRKTGKLLQLHRVMLGGEPELLFGLTNSGVAQVVNGLAARAGIEFSPHDIRRTFATYWMRHCRAASPDFAERMLGVQLGHALRGVTDQHYIRLDVDDVRAHYVSPLDPIDLFGL